MYKSWIDFEPYKLKNILQHKSDLSTSYDFIFTPNSESSRETEEHFVKKNPLEYPDYSSKYSQSQLAQYHNYNFKSNRQAPKSANRPFKAKNLPSYLQSLLKSPKIAQVQQLVQLFFDARLDLRTLYFLKQHLGTTISAQTGVISTEILLKTLDTVFGKFTVAKYPNVFELLMELLVDPAKPESINMKTLDGVIELSEFCKVIVK